MINEEIEKFVEETRYLIELGNWAMDHAIPALKELLDWKDCIEGDFFYGIEKALGELPKEGE